MMTETVPWLCMFVKPSAAHGSTPTHIVDGRACSAWSVIIR